MLGKFGILVVLLILVLLFYLVISFGAGAFSKGETKPEKRSSPAEGSRCLDSKITDLRCVSYCTLFTELKYYF